MDFLLIIAMVAVVWFLVWFAYRMGQDAAARMYQSELGATRAQLRRVRRDLEAAREETAMIRRIGGGDR